MFNCSLCAIHNMQEGGIRIDFRDDEQIDCETCGKAEITIEALELIIKDELPVHLIQGYIRYCKKRKIKIPKITSMNVKSILNNSIVPKNLPEKLNKFLLNIADDTTFGGEIIKYQPTYDYPYAFAKNEEEMEYLIEQLDEIGFIKIERHFNDSYFVKVLSEGWKKVEELKTQIASSKQCFVAMAFDKELDEVYYKGIKKSIEDTGYKPYRIDREEHTDLIPFKMLSEIRKSRFVVADFTFHKNGVYFEAGFAMGLNIPVIWICKRDNFDDTHFDIKQFNHIIYENIDDLYEKLKTRIEAIIL